MALPKLPAVPQLQGIKRVAPFIAALGLATMAVILLQQDYASRLRVLEKERARLMADYQSPISIVVAGKDINPDTVITQDLLAEGKVPEKFVQPFAVRSPNEVIGLIAVAKIAEGEQLLTNKLRRAEDVPADATLSRVMPKGKRAVTIGVDSISGVGGFVRPGDQVDVLWTVKLPGPTPQDAQVVTVALFQDVPVYAVGREIVGRSTQTTATEQQYTVTLALTPQETSYLLFAREQGKIQLSLRPRADENSQVAMSPANTMTFNAFMEEQLGVKSAQAPPPKPTRSVEVYKGLKRDVVVLAGDGQQPQQ